MKQCNVPVVGGHAGNTIVPLISQMSPPVHFHFDQLKAISKKLQKANQETRSGTVYDVVDLSVANRFIEICSMCNYTDYL